MQRSILHVDMDAFFASVEQHDAPEYRGRPVIVGADPKGGRGRGVVAAASYEARRYGIHSAMPVSQAFRRCPHGVYLPVNGKRYAAVSRRIMILFMQYTPLVESISLDEAFLDVSGVRRLKGDAVSIGREIQSRIRTQEGLTASVGIAPNKLLAKIASDLEKPDGFVVVSQDGIRRFLESLPIQRLWGIGKKTEERLHRMGIRTVGDLADVPRAVLEAQFGNVGSHLYACARGIDDRPVEPEHAVKSISNEVTYARDESDADVHLETLLQLAEKVGYRLRRSRLAGRTVTVKVRSADFQTTVRHSTLGKTTALSETIYEEAVRLYRRVDLRGQAVRLLGVGVTQLLEEDGGQGFLFEEGDGKRKRAAIAVDALKEKYGYRVIGKSSRELRKKKN